MELGGEWTNCKHNLPVARNMGGIILQEVSFQLCLEIVEFQQWVPLYIIVKVEGVINSVAITCESIGDVNSIIPLSPMQLLISETSVVMPPPGTFQKGDMYHRKQWQHV